MAMPSDQIDAAAIEPNATAQPPADIQPNGSESAQPAAESAQTAKSGLPDELIHLPAMQALLAGSPPAVSASIAEFASRPEAALLSQHKDAVMKAGIGLYKSLDGNLGVLFNQFYVSGAAVQAADKAGKLLDLAPPIDAVAAKLSGAGEAHPSLHAGAPPDTLAPEPALAAAAPGATPAAPSAAPAPASVQNKLQTQRSKNLQAGSPTSGPKPGAGRLLNAIMKPAV